jgi:organic hydroperoxide reductase OsmC/OhrA
VSEHKVRIVWEGGAGDFLKGTYRRAHVWHFDGGVSVPASPSPAVVRPPYSDPNGVDPEESFVAAISSCHMLTFLHLASKAGVEVLRYEDDATGILTKNERRVPWVSQVVLRPTILYGQGAPSAADERRLHELAHEGCFIANSVTTEIIVEPGAPSALV